MCTVALLSSQRFSPIFPSSSSLNPCTIRCSNNAVWTLNVSQVDGKAPYSDSSTCPLYAQVAYFEVGDTFKPYMTVIVTNNSNF